MFSLAHTTMGSGSRGLIIAHGLLGQGRNWRSIQRHLAGRLESWSVTAVDLRNHGYSPHCDTMSIADMAEDLCGFMHDLSNGDVSRKWSLLGHSMGGKVAMHVALTRPELVQQLVVVDVAPVAYPVSVGAHAEYIEAMLSLDLSLVKSLSEARALLGVSDEAVREFLLTNLVFEEGKARWLPALHVLLASLQHVRGTSDYHGQTFSGPTLFVSGADSHYVLPSHHERIRQLFPRAEMKSIAGAGHWVHADKPTEFLNIVTSFL